jgi:signal peptidase II
MAEIGDKEKRSCELRRIHMAKTQDTTGTAAKTRAMRWAVAGVTVAVLAADQASKCLVMAHATAGSYSAAPLSIGLAANHGATMGVGSGSPLLVTIAALLVAALAAFFALKATSRTAALLLAAVFGGALGNLADRLLRAPGIGAGGVVDWIHLNIAGHGVSLNIADIAIQLLAPAAIAVTLLAARRTAKNTTTTIAAPATPAAVAVTATTAAYALAA